MKLLIVMSSILVATNAASTNRNNDGVCYQGQYYDKVLLKTGLDRPFLLAVDYETDTLYFNYNVAEDEYKSARLNLRTKEFKNIDGIPNGFAYAVDSQHHLLYIGTEDGIYVYNLKTEQFEFYGARGQNIWSLFFKDDVLYYSQYPSEDFYIFSNGEPEKFKELEHTKAHYFVLDDDNNMFFTNDTGLYKQVRGTNDAVLYRRFGIWAISALTLDVHGNVFAGVQDGIYKVEKNEAKMENILPVSNDLFGLVFDKDNNVIYADSKNLFQLERNKNKNC